MNTKTEEKVKVTVEFQGKQQVIECYTFMAALIQYPRDAPVQSVINLSFGRLSTGDRLSAVVAAIAEASRVLKDIPNPIRDMMLDMAIQEGLKNQA